MNKKVKAVKNAVRFTNKVIAAWNDYVRFKHSINENVICGIEGAVDFLIKETTIDGAELTVGITGNNSKYKIEFVKEVAKAATKYLKYFGMNCGTPFQTEYGYTKQIWV